MFHQRIFFTPITSAVVFLNTVILVAVIAPAQTSDSARQMTGRILKMIEEVPDGGPTGEQVGWNWNWYLCQLMDNCRNTPTGEWLQPTEKILNTMFDKMSEGPDGYKGFIGPYIYNENEYWCDVHVSDAILTSHALTFAMIVHDNPALQAKYGDSCKRFIAIARKDLIEKWNARKTFIDDGPFGGYREGTMFCKPGDTKNWFEMKTARTDNKAPSLPFNKALDMAYCMLQLYYLTGETPYKDQAEKIYNRVKAGMNCFDGGYTWNYWEPVLPKDILETAPGRYDLTLWVGTHPYRDYQLGEVEKIIFAYDMGITFTEDDMRRLVHTNLKFMWNGDLDHPQWANSDSKLPGYVKAAPSKEYPTTAGTVWGPLARFDETIAKLAKQSPTGSWTRKYAPDAKVEDFPWMRGINESGGQTEAVVVPSVVPPGESTMILSKSYETERSPVEIYVRPADGDKRTLLTTQQMGNSVQMYYKWDGKIDGQRTPGEYVILWKYRDGERAYPVTLK
ncbi:MAG: hypothetical protein FWC50_10720 [Planctomycetaceae bacterium]|nr:hypothetical protein [Planctomycetaceae bacterium]